MLANEVERYKCTKRGYRAYNNRYNIGDNILNSDTTINRIQWMF